MWLVQLRYSFGIEFKDVSKGGNGCTDRLSGEVFCL